MKALIEELTKLGEEIDTAKSSISNLEGRKAEIVKRMKEEFNVATVKEAEVLLNKLSTEVETLESTITSDFEKLKENFQW